MAYHFLAYSCLENIQSYKTTLATTTSFFFFFLQYSVMQSENTVL